MMIGDGPEMLANIAASFCPTSFCPRFYLQQARKKAINSYLSASPPLRSLFFPVSHPESSRVTQS